MRIVGGRHRGRALLAPADRRVRPTGDRIREALFNILAHGELYRGPAGPLPVGARVVEPFAGTGALGLEALSRGASHVSFIDNDRRHLDLARANAAALDETGRAAFLLRDARAPGPAAAACNLALIDPPYRSDLAAPALVALADQGWLAPGAIAVAEVARKADLPAPPGFVQLESRIYRRTTLVFLTWRGRPDLGRSDRPPSGVNSENGRAET